MVSATDIHIDESSEPRAGLPRALLLWWSLWLLAAWAQAFLWRPPIAPNAQYIARTVQQLLFTVALGVLIVWPVFRLTRGERRSDALQTTFLDWLAIAATLQVIVWPLRIWTSWPLARVAVIDATLITWAMIVGGVIAVALSGPARGRAWREAMAIVAFFMLGLCAPGLALARQELASPATSELLYWSPLTHMWLLGQRSPLPATAAEWLRVGLLAVVAMLLWLAAALRTISANRT